MVLSKMKMWGIKNTNVVTRQSQDRLGDGQKWRAEPGSGWLSPAKGLKSKNSVDVETGGNLCLATHCPLLPGSLHSPGYHCSLPSNKYLLH